MNIIQIIGNLGSDPETRYTPSGQKLTTFRIASNSKKGGKDITTWFRVTVWGDKFDKMISYLKKGSSIMVMGELHKPEIYNNKENQPQVGLEVTAEILKFIPGRSNGERQAQPLQEGGGYAHSEKSFGGFGEMGSHGRNPSFSEEEEQEEVPF